MKFSASARFPMEKMTMTTDWASEVEERANAAREFLRERLAEHAAMLA